MIGKRASLIKVDCDENSMKKILFKVRQAKNMKSVCKYGQIANLVLSYRSVPLVWIANSNWGFGYKEDNTFEIRKFLACKILVIFYYLLNWTKMPRNDKDLQTSLTTSHTWPWKRFWKQDTNTLPLMVLSRHEVHSFTRGLHGSW